MIHNGADINLTDIYGRDAYHIALANCDLEVAYILQNKLEQNLVNSIKPQKICACCGIDKAKLKCGRCLLVYYCSEKCLKDDSKNHKDKYHRKCAVCKNYTIQKCKNCKSIYYCSKECQIKDWDQHKLNCNHND